MQTFLVHAAMVGCLRAQRDHRRRLREEPISAQAAGRGRSGMEDEEREEKEEGMACLPLSRRRRLADSYDS